MKKTVEAEGSELVLKNSAGDHAIIPKDKRAQVSKLLKQKKFKEIDKIIEGLPSAPEYAQGGGLYTDPPEDTTLLVNQEAVRVASTSTGPEPPIRKPLGERIGQHIGDVARNMFNKAPERVVPNISVDKFSAPNTQVNNPPLNDLSAVANIDYAARERTIAEMEAAERKRQAEDAAWSRYADPITRRNKRTPRDENYKEQLDRDYEYRAQNPYQSNPEPDIYGSLEDVRKFYQGYIDSPMYEERLRKGSLPTERKPDNMSEEEWLQEFKGKRLSKANKMEIHPDKELSVGYWGSTDEELIGVAPTHFYPHDMLQYSPGKWPAGEDFSNKYLDKPLHELFGVKSDNVPGIIAHEASHVTGANEESKSNTHLSKRDIKEIRQRNMQKHGHYQNRSHNNYDTRAVEPKADLDAARFLLHKDKIYDAGTQEFTREHYKKFRSKYYKKNNMMRRLLDNFSPEDVIWMMNNIAEKDGDSNTQNLV